MLFYKFITKKNFNVEIVLTLLLTLYFIVFQIVFKTGGTKNVFPHLMYLPIIISALYFEVKGGIMGGVLGGVLLAIIPVNTKTMELQNTGTIIIRIVTFVLIGGFIGSIFNILKKQYRDMEEIYSRDSVTLIPNRIALLEELKKNYIQEKSKLLIVVYIENIVEVFNIVGHTKSEITLKSISEFFQQIVKKDNVKIFNSHSLKFEFLLEDLEVDKVENWMENFRENLKKKPIYIDGKYIPLKIIMGVSEVKFGKNFEKIICEAYEAVEFASYNNKEYHIYDTVISQNLQTTYLVSQINEAINNDELYLEYQPKLNLTNNKIEEVEALIRWKHPKEGIISPDNFIPKLEKTDSIKVLTLWVLRRTIRDIKIWESKGINIIVSINVTPRDLKDKNFANNLINSLLEFKIEYSKINLEITETDLIRGMNDVIETIIYLREKGIKISIDDFGTGYSSLSYINILPIDYIKIDRSFVKNLMNNEKNRYLLKDTIQLLHNLGKIVVAEGVETLETLELLKELGCEVIQGYYISKPLAKKNLEIFLSKFL